MRRKTQKIIKKLINIKFTSFDQKIRNFNVTYYNTDIFENVLDKIFLKFPNIKNKDNTCL